jgi:hypothetical protein
MSKTTSLHRYWIRFDPSRKIPTGFLLGCGITARSEAEALERLRNAAPEMLDGLVIAEITLDVAIPDLDQKHVVSNMGDPTQPGVWFPNFGNARK